LAACDALREAEAVERSWKDVLAAYLAPADHARSVDGLQGLDPQAWNTLVPFVLERAVRLGPALFAQLCTDGLTSVLGSDHRTSLEVARAAAEQGSARWRDDLAAILDAFRDSAVPVAVLKGPILAAHAYPDPVMRPMSDLDLLVPRDRLAQAERILLDLGYGPEAPWRQNIAASCIASEELPAFYKAGATQIDVHWAIVDPRSPFSVAADGLWDRLVPAQMAGRSALTLAPEDFLLHLCAHAAYAHGFEAPLRCFCDVAWFIHGRALDWDTVVARALEWRVERLAYAVIAVAHAIFRAEASAVLPRLSGRAVDAKVVPIIVDHCLRAAVVGSDSWRTTRCVLDAWLRLVVGSWPRPGW